MRREGRGERRPEEGSEMRINSVCLVADYFKNTVGAKANKYCRGQGKEIRLAQTKVSKPKEPMVTDLEKYD